MPRSCSNHWTNSFHPWSPASKADLLVDLDQCVDLCLSALSRETRDRFAKDPIATLRTELGMAVRAVDHLGDSSRSDGGACDGMSFLSDGVILYSPTPESRREYFTLGHELGHWLVEQSGEAFDWLGDQAEPAKLLETVCDRIAQRLLLSDDLANEVLGSGPVTAQFVLTLFSNSNASRPVCAIAAAQRLRLGAVLIVDIRTGQVTHASVKPDPVLGWPRVYPWPGQVLDAGHPLMQWGSQARKTLRTRWRMPWGAQERFYVDAVADERRIFAVLSADDLWGVDRFHAPSDREFDTRPTLTGTCCGKTFERRGIPCPDCGDPYCPECGLCRCQKVSAREVVCSSCFLQYQPHLVVDGKCFDCRS